MYFKTMYNASFDNYIKRKILRWYFFSDVPAVKKLINLEYFLKADRMVHVTYFEFKKLIT